MGFISRRLVPRPVRRVLHPVRAVKRAVIPPPVRKVLNPIDAYVYELERRLRGRG